MISRASRPFAIAFAARSCERSANRSWSLRDTSNSRATFSAVCGIESVSCSSCMRGLMKRQPIVVSWISVDRDQADDAFGITNGARDIDSTPPATIRSASPARTARAAIASESRLEPQSRLTVLPDTSVGSPASSQAIRATLRLSSPAWFAQPNTTSSTAPQSTSGSRSASAVSTCAARSSGRTGASAPPYRPNGVRIPSTRNAVIMSASNSPWWRQQYENC